MLGKLQTGLQTIIGVLSVPGTCWVSAHVHKHRLVLLSFAVQRSQLMAHLQRVVVEVQSLYAAERCPAEW